MKKGLPLREMVPTPRMNYSFIFPSMLILLVIMGYYFFRPRLPIRLNRAFLAILVIDICTEILEVASFRLNETWTEHAPELLWVINVLYYIFTFIRSYMFFIFTVSVLDAKTLLWSKLRVFAPIVYIPCVLVALSTPWTHWLFRIEEGFHSGPFLWILYACGCSYIAFSTIGILRHIKELETWRVSCFRPSWS